VDRGLGAAQKHIPCRYFYDYTGSQIFERICRLQEYYLTRTETEILQANSGEICSSLPGDVLLVELGSGSCLKTQVIIAELLKHQAHIAYSPIDISKQMLEESSNTLLERFDSLEVVPVVAEYTDGLRLLRTRPEQAKLILWLGSSIGNFRRREAIRFLKNIVLTLSPQDYFLIGFDLQKDRRKLEEAYNDSRGVTAEFNLNLLARINRELGGRFDLGRFEHSAVYNEEKSRIEMYLISTQEQEVYIADLDRSYHFHENERIHTENSYKYSLDTIRGMADQAGMEICRQWFDSRRYFNLTLLRIAER
jgi:dimethylhistidine N-methyltransferase